MKTYRRLGRCGRLGNQLWQIAATMGIAAEAGEAVSFPEWEYERRFAFPPVFTGAAGDDVSDSRDPYLQDLRWIAPVEDELGGYVAPSREAWGVLRPLVREHRPEGASVVQVRRGDYAEAWRGHGMLPADWYLANWPAGRVLVFSDEPEWCRVNLPGTVVEADDWAALLLMALCDRFVISNSTFGWWPAWVSRRPTVYPTPWFTGLPYGEMFPDWWEAAPRC